MSTTSENITANEPRFDYFKFVRENHQLGHVSSAEEVLERARLRRQEIENQQKNKDKDKS
jgi:hypothetical protein